MKQGETVDMTTGPITPQIIHFTVPLIIGNFCLLTYNAADSIIVGRFIGANALAAVGAASPIMNIVLFLIVGICLGMSVLMGNFFGAGDIARLKREISTALIAGGVFTLIIMVLGLFFSHALLSLMHTPPAIIDDATLFLQIIFVGMFFTFIYNIYASTLRSMGNSNASLYFLVASAVLNILMDILFVAVLKFGIAGAACATVIAEALSALFCIIYVRKRIPILKYTRHEFVFDRSLLRETINYSSVAGMQQITLHIGKLLVQGAVNPLGIFAIAAFNAVGKIDDFVMIVQQNIAHGTTGFLAQNNGGGTTERLHKGFFTGLKMEVVYSLIMGIIIFAFARPFVAVFVGNEGTKVVESGVQYLRIMSFLYLLPGVTNILQGYFRGLGKLKITLNSTFTQIVGRVIAAYVMAPFFGLKGIALACLVGWICMLAYELPRFMAIWKKKRESSLVGRK
jgi:putative MATE family efflux protein